MDSLIGPVPDDWTERRLEEICEILPGPSPGGIDLKDRESVEDPIVPVVTPKDMRHNRIDDDWTVGIAEEAARRLPPRYRLVLDDIVCSRTGQLGRQALVGENQRGWILGPACLLVRVREISRLLLWSSSCSRLDCPEHRRGSDPQPQHENARLASCGGAFCRSAGGHG
jgi:type I restriction enzyme S subunit